MTTLVSSVRGAWLILPIVLVYVFVARPDPWSDIARGARVAALAMIAGALSGLAYGLIGRHLRRGVPAGRYLAGIVSTAPYVLIVSYIERFSKGEPLWRLPDRMDLLMVGIMALLFGSVIGHTWFADRA